MKYFPCGGPSLEINEEEIRRAGEYGTVIVAVVGEPVSMSGEAASRTDITLPGNQRRMLEKLLETGKPVIAVLMNGRPLALEWENAHLPAILECWHLGIQMGNAVASVLTGEYNPEGRLSVSFPAVTGQCPLYYNHPRTGRPVKELKGFTKVHLIPGEEQRVCLSLSKENMGFYDNSGHYLLEQGTFRFYIGGNSRESLMTEIDFV